ncbi:MAG: tripartite tricarboxylate transporter substrate binding protein [Alphaproteobacteria bacterium]|nr:tripartite tricarboxylate transporter substrate binding protein [Alphaproteobacteria bacterium]
MRTDSTPVSTTALRLGMIAGVAATLAVVTQAGTAFGADPFPSKEIQVISHAAPGGGTDVTARMMMIRSRRELAKGIKALADTGASLNVVYKRGGSGKVAHEYLMSRPADGHTLLALTQTHFYLIAMGKSPMKPTDLVGVARAMDDPTFIVVGKNSKYKTIEEVIAASKDKPLNWGVSQIGGTEHVGLARFAKAAGIKFKVVPFGSGGKMMQALLSNAIDATLPNVSESGGQIEDGTVRPLLLLADKRLAGYKNVPTSHEKGWPLTITTTRGYAVRAGTPPEIVAKLEKALLNSMKHEVFAGYLRSSGLDPKTSPAGSKVWTKQIQDEIAIARESLMEIGIIKKK